MRRHDFPDRDLVNRSYTHSLAQLFSVAGLDAALKVELAGNPAFPAYLEIVKGWSEQSRYERRGRDEARALHTAIADQQYGVLRWIKQSW